MRIVKSKRAPRAGRGEAEVVVLYTTVSNNDAARRLAVALLEERLIACANVFPVWSMYHWEGQLQDENEIAILMKTHPEHVPALMARIPELHPYETPAIEVFSLSDAHPPFAAWIAEETGAYSAPGAGTPRGV
jgi:periplasmic divalent cation tolerance protein